MRAAHEPPNSQRDDCAADHEDDEPEQGSPLTVKLRGRAEAPAIGAEGAQFPSARGDNTEAPHGPLQRLLEPSVTTLPSSH